MGNSSENKLIACAWHLIVNLLVLTDIFMFSHKIFQAQGHKEKNSRLSIPISLRASVPLYP